MDVKSDTQWSPKSASDLVQASVRIIKFIMLIDV